MAAYLDELAAVRGLLNSRYGDLHRGRVKPIAAPRHFRQSGSLDRSDGAVYKSSPLYQHSGTVGWRRRRWTIIGLQDR